MGGGNWVYWVLAVGVVLMFASALPARKLGVFPKPPPVWMPAVVTVAVLASALWVILSGDYDEASAKWAFGAVGLVVGFWLK